MSLTKDVEEQETRLKKIEERLHLNKTKKEKKWTIKIPSMIKRAALKQGHVAALVLRANKNAEPKKAYIRDGLIHLEGDTYAYEAAAVYHLKQGTKTIPLVVIPEWRLLPVGGKTEEYMMRVWNGEEAQKVAKELKITNEGVKTMIRAIEQAEVGKDEKKKGGISPIVWLMIGVGIIYVLSQLFGGG